MNWLLVFVGGGLGSLARYGLARWLPAADFAQGKWPWYTLVANLLACTVLGLLLALVAREWLSKPLQLLLMTGFCGGFSTFSTFVAEAWLLAEEGFFLAAAGYVFLSLVVGTVALVLVFWLLR